MLGLDSFLFVWELKEYDDNEGGGKWCLEVGAQSDFQLIVLTKISLSHTIQHKFPFVSVLGISCALGAYTNFLSSQS